MAGNRPCFCDRVRRGKPYSAGTDCRHCWNYWHRSDFNIMYGGDGLVLPIEGATRPVVIHAEGEEQVDSAPAPATAAYAPPPAQPAATAKPLDDSKPTCIHIGKVVDRNQRACPKCWTYECEVMGLTVPNTGIKPGLPTCVGCQHYEGI